jgi:signal transduction histidine kinase
VIPDPADPPDARAPRRGSRVPYVSPSHPRTDRHQATLDVVLAGCLSPLVLAGLRSESGAPLRSVSLVAAVVLILLATWSLALRRHHPVAVLSAVVAAALVLDLALGGNSAALVPQIAVAVYTMALGVTWRRASLIAAAAALSLIVSAAVAQHDAGVATVVSLGAVIGGATAVGLYVATRRAYIDALQQRNLHLERERALLSQQAVAEERVRIARELHDVVAHHVSLLVVQAGGVRVALGPDHPARPVLESMAATGRQALDEMRRMLGLLRIGEVGSSPGLAPQPGLSDIETLVAQTRAAGLPIELSVEGDPRPLPVGVDLSAYRIVQEALTNVIKHAGPARVRVALRHGEHSLEIEVLDNGRGNVGAARPAGHGLVGMRERVALFGGELVTGPAPRGGFSVLASLPLDSLPR